jgi:hypothetical protein
MAMIDRNFTFATNGTVSAADLHNLIDSATIYQDLITGQVPITSVGTNYELLIADTTNPNAAPNAVTVYDLFEDALTAGTYTNANISAALTYGTATGNRTVSTSATITTGTIPNLTSSTANITLGTIATLNSTTPTFLGAITASTNTINVGSGQIYKDASGNVGIGTASPAVKLDVQGVISSTIASKTAKFDAAGNSIYTSLNDGTKDWRVGAGIVSSGLFSIRNNTDALNAITIDSSGNVGIGTASPVSGNSLTVFDSINGGIVLQNNTNYSAIAQNGHDVYFDVGRGGTAGNLYIRRSSSLTSSMTIDSSGNVGIGTTSGGIHRIVKSSASDFALQVSNTSSSTPYVQVLTLGSAAPNDATSMFLRCDDTGLTGRIQLRSNGGLANFSANNVNLSDERLKESIQPSPSYLDKICSISVVNYKYKDQTHNDYNLGVIAQQVEAVCPELVDVDGFGETPEDGVPLKSIYQTDLQYALMKCIQELKSENDSLKSRIEALEAA